MIYPVYLASWYPAKVTKADSFATLEDHKSWHENARWMVDCMKCARCGNKCLWKKAWGSHSIPWGHGDVFCSKECCFAPRK